MYYDHFKNRPYPDNDGNSHDIEFLPCPFCGDAPHVMPQGNHSTKKRSVTVKCKTCRIERTDAALNYGFDWLYKVAAESWNKRTSGARSDALLAAARHLFKTGHKAAPFMTLDSGPDGCSLSMKFKTLDDGQVVHAALVRFFTANNENTGKAAQ